MDCTKEQAKNNIRALSHIFLCLSPVLISLNLFSSYLFSFISISSSFAFHYYFWFHFPLCILQMLACACIKSNNFINLCIIIKKSIFQSLQWWRLTVSIGHPFYSSLSDKIATSRDSNEVLAKDRDSSYINKVGLSSRNPLRLFYSAKSSNRLTSLSPETSLKAFRRKMCAKPREEKQSNCKSLSRDN